MRRAATALTALWLAAEAAHLLADRPAPPRRDKETLLVLGCPTRSNGRPSARQRWRVALVARNAGADTRVVFSGAGEADVMARIAIAEHGLAADRISCEDEALTTWDNIGNSAALIEAGGIVRIVSDPLHARRGERYWRLRFPSRADELRPAQLYRFGEHPLLKVATAAYEVLLQGVRYRPAS